MNPQNCQAIENRVSLTIVSMNKNVKRQNVNITDLRESQHVPACSTLLYVLYAICQWEKVCSARTLLDKSGARLRLHPHKREVYEHFPHTTGGTNKWSHIYLKICFHIYEIDDSELRTFLFACSTFINTEDKVGYVSFVSLVEGSPQLFIMKNMQALQIRSFIW